MSQIAGGVLLLFLLVLATRAVGQSALSVASITAVGKSFDKRVGVAMGIYSVLLSVFFALAFVAVGEFRPHQRLADRMGAGRRRSDFVAAGVALLLRERPAAAIAARRRVGRRRAA